MRTHVLPPTPAPPPACGGPCVSRIPAGGGVEVFKGMGGPCPPIPLRFLPPLRQGAPGANLRLRGEGGKGGEVGGARSENRSNKPTIDVGEAGSGWRALVIGLGNPLRGDDGLGPAVIAALQPAAGSGLTLVESDGHDLVEWLASQEFARIVVVDAADLGRTPGSWTRLTPERLAASKGRLTHGMGLRESLELLAALGLRRTAPISIYAVQPAAVGWGPGLSREVGQAIRPVADAIRQELCLPLLPRREGQCSGQTRKSVACPAAARRHN